MKRRTFKAMGTEVELAVSDSVIPHSVQTDEQGAARITRLLRQTEERIRGYENRLSRFIEDNELYSLNHSQGRWFKASDDLVAVLRTAEAAFVRSKGLFNPFMGTEISRMGYDKSFDEMSEDVSIEKPAEVLVKDTSETSAARHSKALQTRNPVQSQTHSRVELLDSPLLWSENSDYMVQLMSGTQVDLGGIAKGWIVEQAAKHLRENGVNDFVIDAGGDMVCSGADEGRPWTVGIENPVFSGNALVLDTTSTSIATSGTYNRKWQFEGRDVHHIIDPRTSSSAETDIVSSSVLHQSLTEAEWMAKTLLIKGSDTGVKWITQQNSSGWVVVLKNGEVKHAWM